MVQEKGVAIREDKAVAIYELETRFAMATRQRELLEQYIKERLHPGKHFYKIERGDDESSRGGQQKPSLTKEGAELICLPHALKAHYQWLSGPDSPPLDDSPYQITMNCELESNGKFAGEGVGSASSMQTKKDGTRVQRQKDPGLRHNATIKMACKSAYIAATLNSTAASEFFTQDLEDDQTGSYKKEVDKSEHWCAEHNTNFFKGGKMKGYAHKLPDGTWCNESDEQPESAPQAVTAKTKPVKAWARVIPPEEAEEPPEEVDVDKRAGKSTPEQHAKIREIAKSVDVKAYIKKSGWSATTAAELTYGQAETIISEFSKEE